MSDILVIDDQERTIALCRRAMPEYEWHGPARTWAEAEAMLRRLGRSVQAVLLDIHFDIEKGQLLGLPDGADEGDVARARRRQGFEILAALRKNHPDLPVVLMTARGEIGLEREADRHHAEEYTYFLDDEDLDARTLRTQVEGILQARRGRDRDGPVFWGRSPQMRRIRQRLVTLARGRLPVTLAGPTGTGKSLIARHFIHERSGRKGAFVSVDLSTLPRDLVASHLFGSVKGAYTGSVADRRGAFEEAHGGTLFLDEIGNLLPDVQKMLLTVLQEGEVTRLGDTRPRKVDIKLVVATNEDLADLVRRGDFRADLYMRLNPACTLALPPLAERKVDMARLLGFAVERIVAAQGNEELLSDYARRFGLVTTPELRVVCGSQVPEPDPHTLVVLFPERTMRLLAGHSWPGNLRELSMTVENALNLCLAEAIEAGQQPGGDNKPGVLQVRPKLVRDLLLAVRMGEDEGDEAGWRMEVVVKPGDGLNKVAVDVERQYFRRLYVQERGDFAGMARVLLGDADGARKVQLRFNQLGLKVRDLKGQVG